MPVLFLYYADSDLSYAILEEENDKAQAIEMACGCTTPSEKHWAWMDSLTLVDIDRFDVTEFPALPEGAKIVMLQGY
jgi:hypothetical protein